MLVVLFFVKQKTAYEMRISDWSSDVFSSDLQSFNIVGFIPVPGQAVVVPDRLLLAPGLGLLQSTEALRIHEIVVAPDERRGGLPLAEMLARAQRGVNVIARAGFFEREARLTKLNVVDTSALVFSGRFDRSFPRNLSTRVFV